MDDDLLSRCIDKLLTISVKARTCYDTEDYRLKFENQDDITLKDIFEVLHERTKEDLVECGIEITEDIGNIIESWSDTEALVDLYSLLFPSGMITILREDDSFRDGVNNILGDMEENTDSKLCQYLDLINSDKCIYKSFHGDMAERLKSVISSNEVFDKYLQDIYDQCLHIPMNAIDEGFMIKYILKLRLARRVVLDHINSIIKKKLISVDYGDQLEIDLFNHVRSVSSNIEMLKQLSWCEHIIEHSDDPTDLKLANQIKKTIGLNFPLDFLHLTQLSIIDDQFNIALVKRYALLMVLWKSAYDNVSLKESMQLFTDHVIALLSHEDNITILNELIELSAVIKSLYPGD